VIVVRHGIMDFDDLRREKITTQVTANLESTLTLSLALKAASRLSNGAAVSEGSGLLGCSSKGSFNICYWVRVEGLSKQWVVRFPLIGMIPTDLMTAKFNSEIATLKFLAEKTLVRVPRVIGYSLGDDDIPIPFVITENVEGLPLTVYWSRFGKNASRVDLILDSLAQQYLELLSHPFDQIGSLRLTSDGNHWELATSPLSVDQFDISRDGFTPTLTNPYRSSHEYYVAQSHLFERYANEQRNSVYDERDGILKYLTSEVFRRIIPQFINSSYNKGPFYLFHLDLHPANIITNRHWEVEAILDWEFTTTAPVEIALSAPRCIMDLYGPDQMAPSSYNYKAFEARLRIFVNKVEKHLQSSHRNMSHLAPTILSQLSTSLSENRAFFAWCASDVRNMFSLLWDHLALATPLSIQSGDDSQTFKNIIFQTEASLVDAMLETIGEQKVRDWAKERLLSLDEYKKERASFGTETSK
jgi:Phosphotransferase enzyme family